ncbi:hypothetical protein ACROYT_G018850 [Oculina patagonica]
MTLARVLTVLVLANAFNVVSSCGGGGGPCTWTTCRHEWRNDWSPGISQGRCVQQRRNAHHITTTHGGSEPCPPPTHCSPRTQHRTMCSCKYALCYLGSWSSWADMASPVNNHCASQQRTRSYALFWLYRQRENNCDGIGPQSCPSPQSETREKDCEGSRSGNGK